MIKRINNRHSILIIAYLVITVLIILSGSLIMRSIAENRIALRYSHSNKALWLAEAGLQKGMWELNNNNCAGFKRCNTIFNCSDCTCSNADKCLAGSLGTSGDYDVLLERGNARMSSTGYFPSKTSAEKLQRGIEVTIKQNTASLFVYAAFAKSRINLSGPSILIDSYDSSKGDYGGANISANAEIDTNGTSDNVIELLGGTVVKGDAGTGPGGTVFIEESATLTGTITYDNDVNLPPVVVPAELESLLSGGAYLVSGGSQTLNAGDYKYTSLIVSNGGQLNINGNVRIYITGTSGYVFQVINNGTTLNILPGGSLKIYMEGDAEFEETAVVNASRNPSLFTLYSKSTSDYALKMDDSAKLYGKIYFPDATVKVKDSIEVYGSIIGRDVWVLNRAAIHFDESLRSATGEEEGTGGAQYSISTWQEFNI